MSNQLAAERQTAFSSKKLQRQATILIIDDAKTVVDLLHDALTQVGHRVLPALCGQAGLELFKDNRVDIILCDLDMPNMDGWKVAEEILTICKQRGVLKPPFILVTAWANKIREDNRIAELGVDAILGKPVNFPNLLQTIDRAIQRQSN